jgi:hypothetical protein
MELSREPRIGLMADALVGTVVHIDEQWLPVGWQCLVIDSIAVVL